MREHTLPIYKTTHVHKKTGSRFDPVVQEQHARLPIGRWQGAKPALGLQSYHAMTKARHAIEENHRRHRQRNSQSLRRSDASRNDSE